MNILFITWVYPPTPGGVSWEVTRNLAKAGHNVRVFVPWRMGQKRKESIEGIKVRRVFLPRRPSRLMAPLFLLRVILFLCKHRVDIVHILYNSNCFLLPLIGRRFFKNRKMKYVLHQLTFSVNPQERKRLVENRKVLAESKYFDAVITSNRYMKESCYPQGLRNLISIVPIGVNLGHFKPALRSEILNIRKRFFQTDDKVFVYEGTFSGRKLEVLIRAFSALIKKYGKAKLLIIGSGNGADSLKQLSQDLGIADKIHFTGEVSYNDIPLYIGAADIAVSYIPIVDYYDVQTALKTIEYLSCGLPVIATATKTNNDLIKDGYNGLLIKDSQEALADSMFLLATKDELRKNLGGNAREAIIHLNWETIVRNKLIAVYRGVLR